MHDTVMNKQATRGAVLALAVAGVSVLAAQVQAQTVWIGGGADNNWSTDANWDAGEPDLATTANLNNGDTILINQAGEEANFANINGSGTFDIRPGAELTTGGSVRIGFGGGSDGALLMSGGTVTITGGGSDLTIGDAGTTDARAVGTATISGGAITAPDNMLIGGGANADGVLSQTGGDLAFDNVVVVGGGPTSTGLYNIEGGSVTQLGSVGFLVGNNGTATGTVNQSGGTVNAVNMNVGNNGTGQYTHTGGALNVTDALTVAANSGSVGTFIVRGSDPGGSITAGSFAAGAGDADLVFQIEDSSGTTLIDIAGAANLEGALIDLELLGYTPDAGETFNLLAASDITGNYSLAAGDEEMFDLSVASIGGRELLQATVIPEPGTAVLAVLGAGGLLIRRRR